MVYYIGHGAEYKGHLNAVLPNGSLYDLQRKTDQLARNRLVHVMFDCNRLNWKNAQQTPSKNSNATKETHFIYTYSGISGKPTKAQNASVAYVNHLRTQIKDIGVMLPSALQHLNGHGSIRCVHNMKKPVYAPIQAAQPCREILQLPTFNAEYGEVAFDNMVVVCLPKLWAWKHKLPVVKKVRTHTIERECELRIINEGDEELNYKDFEQKIELL